LLHTILPPFVKAEFMPILPAKTIFNYFMNKCDGLAGIKTGVIFAEGLRVVKSLTNAVSRHKTTETLYL
jgi:hypothetical protein